MAMTIQHHHRAKRKGCFDVLYQVDTRTPKECLIQWTGVDHPGISKADWTTGELTKLEALAKQYQERNWIQIALDLGTNRTSAQCFKKYMSGKATKKMSKK